MKGLRGLFESLGAILGETPESVEKAMTGEEKKAALYVSKAMLRKGETLDEFSSGLRQAVRDYAAGGGMGTRKDDSGGGGVPVYLESAYDGWGVANNYKDQTFYRFDFTRDDSGAFFVHYPSLL